MQRYDIINEVIFISNPFLFGFNKVFFIFAEQTLNFQTMQNEKVFIATDRNTLVEVLNEMFYQKTESKTLPEFEKDRLSKKQAAKLAGISIPTLSRQVALGKFKEYSLGRRKYYYKSEIIESLRKK